jgi:hypothetical protein
MPVMLTTDFEYALWLNSEITERRLLEELMRPMAAGRLVKYEAQKQLFG